jgi:hypothetical protein
LKKILAILLITVLISTSVSQGLFVFAENDENYNDVKAFADDLSQMLRENNIDNHNDVYMNQMYASGEAYEGVTYNDFESCRLIVKSEKLIDFQGAIDCVSGYNDLFVLQYDSIASTKNAYEYYLSCNNEEYVEPDLIAEAAVDDITEVEIPGDIASAANDWLSDKIGFNDIKDRLADKIKDDYVLVAVIDSGADLDHDLLKD